MSASRTRSSRLGIDSIPVSGLSWFSKLARRQCPVSDPCWQSRNEYRFGPRGSRLVTFVRHALSADGWRHLSRARAPDGRAAVGILVIVLTLWLLVREQRRWLRVAGLLALGAVVLQGILGGLTVLFFLPTLISVGHAMLAQTFLLLVILIAYGESDEWRQRSRVAEQTHVPLVSWWIVLGSCVYLQLLLGAIMRHTGAGLAILD